MTEFEKTAALFPNPARAPLDDMPICYGGNLKPLTLIAAYSKGLFPWFSASDPILWWSLHPRCVFYPDDLHISRRSMRALKNSGFTVTADAAFIDVICACANPRADYPGAWLLDSMIEAYIDLHKLGYAHSLETWRDGRLVGGLYGVALGKAFFGESMFHTVTEASRAAFLGLHCLMRQYGFQILDCQQENAHMLNLGAKTMPRKYFLHQLKNILDIDAAREYEFCPWTPWQPELTLDISAYIKELKRHD